MPTHDVVLTAAVPAWILDKSEAEHPSHARSWILSQAWYERRRIDWEVSATIIAPDDDGSTQHAVSLSLEGADGARPVSASLRFALRVSCPEAVDPGDKARRLLDLPGSPVSATRACAARGTFDLGSFSRIRGHSVIGPLAPDWPIDRMLTAYSSHLGSYGQGGVGLSGWQCNGGSWIVLPLKHSDCWIWLTHEEIAPAADFRSLAITIDQRILGVHPDQLGDFRPWEHRYCGHPTIEDLPDFGRERLTISRFEAAESGFVLEAANGLSRWRFAMGDHLPRPIWAGSRAPRQLQDGESIADAFVLTHDCYLDV
ncbi:hypothetical protein [Sphingobium sp. Cam5-1]|uniref:hypothetical protein n=1 Tax=Sphingobium sp. Cam5-1 TaxID=2789327 RepID=UPI0018AD1AFB|nr:hypothetical protein [Sphingobium sp. Cam5-1]QPI75515.1 hypothetical protein IZV00_18850 [Sphingobium sp. Cam5-1]